MCDSLDDFEYYPDLVGSVYDYDNMINKLNNMKYITEDDRTEIYYRKIYQDIYDDNIINYYPYQYINVVKTIIDYNMNEKYTGIINRIQEILTFKETYHKVKTSEIEQTLLQMVNETKYNKLSIIYKSPIANICILYRSELERQQNCELYIRTHPILRLIENIRYYIKGQYYCGLAILEILQKELLHVNGILFKIELNIRNHIILPHIKNAFIIILNGYKIKQASILKQMNKINIDIKNIKYKRNHINPTDNNIVIFECHPLMQIVAV